MTRKDVFDLKTGVVALAVFGMFVFWLVAQIGQNPQVAGVRTEVNVEDNSL